MLQLLNEEEGSPKVYGGTKENVTHHFLSVFELHVFGRSFLIRFNVKNVKSLSFPFRMLISSFPLFGLLNIEQKFVFGFAIVKNGGIPHEIVKLSN